MIFPPDLSPELILGALRTKSFGRSLDVRMATGSTNSEARLAAQMGEPDGHVIVADRQTHGRGTRGRAWSSPAGTDLYFSILSRQPIPPDSLGLLTLGVGLGVANAIAPHAQDAPAIKWPNDVWLGGKKCAGILVESRSVGSDLDSVVIGVGVNVNRQDFGPELAEVATSLRGDASDGLDRARMLAELLGSIESEVDRLRRGEGGAIIDDVSARLVGVGNHALCDGHEGVIVGLDDEGSLRLRDGNTEHLIRNGTLTFADASSRSTTNT